METFKDTVKLERAMKRVKAMKEFYRHLIVYIIVNVILWIMHIADMRAGESFFCWSNFSLAFFWGFGLFCHWLGAFKPGSWLGKNWEERKIQEYMDREKTKKQQWE